MNFTLDHVKMGLGCAGMSEFYGTPDSKSAQATLARALELGINFFDTADVYGKGENEKLLSWLTQQERDKKIISSKCGIIRDSNEKAGELNLAKWAFTNSPDYLKQAVDNSLQRLNTDYIDILYLHVVKPETPIEDSVGCLTDLIQAGKIRAIGLSNIFDAELIRRAQATHPITAIQNEYSLIARNTEDIFPLCHELNITFYRCVN